MSVYSTGPDPTPRDCREAYLNGSRKDGVYTIDPGCGKPFNVFCDMEKGGWTVFQSRMAGSENFNRNWTDYVAGFGQLEGEHWLGLEKLVCLTNRGPRTELRVNLADYEGNYKYALYSFFSVGNIGTNYTLNIAGYTGTAGDSLTYHNGMQFSTKDRDNDRNSAKNCANEYHGAWWYKDCHDSNLNGLYRSGQGGIQGVVWDHFLDKWISLFAQMKLHFCD